MTRSATATLSPRRPSGSTEERLMDAALGVIGEQGYHGATTRAIAAEAGVSEVTLFRRFGSKGELAAAALAHATTEFREAGAEPTESVFEDLLRLGQAYQGFVNRRPALVARLLAEVAAGTEIGAIVSELIAGNAESAAAVVGHHQRSGRLVEGPTDTIVSAFLGPILVGATVGRVLAAGSNRSSAPLDVVEHTERFLAGHRT